MQLIRSAAILSLAASGLAQGDLGALLATQPELSILASLLNTTGLTPILSQSKNITILAPNNSAITTTLGNGLNATLASQTPAQQKQYLTAFLENHVLQGYYPANATSSTPIFANSLLKPNTSDITQSFTGVAAGSPQGLVKNGTGVTILTDNLETANVVQADIPLGSEIIIHVIDATLPLPEQAIPLATSDGLTDFASALNVSLASPGTNPIATELAKQQGVTVFIPNNEAFEDIASVLNSINTTVLTEVLAYHVIGGGNLIFSSQLYNTTVPSIQGGSLTISVLSDGSAFVNDAEIILPNIIFHDGVAHVIDNVLNPLVPFNRSQLMPGTPAESRVAYAGASSASSLALPTVTATAASTTTASTITATAASTTTASKTSAPSASYTGAAATRAVPGSFITAAAVLAAGGVFAFGM